MVISSHRWKIRLFLRQPILRATISLEFCLFSGSRTKSSSAHLRDYTNMYKYNRFISRELLIPLACGMAIITSPLAAFAETAKQPAEVVEQKPKTLFDLFKKPNGAAKTAPAASATDRPTANNSGISSNAIEGLLKQKSFSFNGKTIVPSTYADFYKANRNKAIWTEKGGFFGVKKDLSPAGEKLIAALKDAKNDGLDPSAYFKPISGSLKKLNAAELAEVELYLTAAFVELTRDLFLGKTDPSTLGDEIVPSPKKFDANAILKVASSQGIGKAFEMVRPSHPQYAALRGLMAQTLDPKKRAQIAINLERWRWLPSDLGTNYVFVNQPAFKVYIYSNGSIVDQRNVVVGKPEHKSPMFSDVMEYVEFNPQWNVPVSIAVNEFLPKLVSDRNYAKTKGYTVYEGYGENAQEIDSRKVNWSKVKADQDTFPYRFVQDEGGDNALGEVKFLFPNTFNVYLHDTPSKKLFKQPARAFSHGCIRVQDPLEFAEKIFGISGGIAPDQIRPLVKTGVRKQVNLKTKMPVYLTYFTIWVEGGKPIYYSDMYGRDAALRPLI